jgi:steroid delta-isomerase-like uncharacterized protein
MTREETLARHLAAENAHDLDGIMATYAESPTVTINGRAIVGHERVRAFHQRFGFAGDGGSFSDVTVVERARHGSDGAIILEQTLSGRQIAPYLDVPATGRSFSVAVCTVYRFTPAGELAAEDVYFDSAQLSAQLRG